jgi:hypothetical protein
MTKEVRMILATVLVLLGLGLMVGGIVTERNGAVVVGLCVAVAATYQWAVMKKRS